MLNIPADDSRAVAVISAIRSGDLEGLGHLLNDNPGLATARIVDAQGVSRTLLHIATDWPGHFPNSAMTVAALVAAGADVNARVTHPSRPECRETPLHWAVLRASTAAIAKRDYQRFLECVSRRTQADGGVSSGTWGRSELDRIRQAHAAAGGARKRREGFDHLAEQPGR
jgi:hypothetical protein